MKANNLLEPIIAKGKPCMVEYCILVAPPHTGIITAFLIYFKNKEEEK